VTIDLHDDPCAVIRVPAGSTLAGIRITQGGSDLVMSVEDVYLLLLEAESPGASVAIESTGVSAAYRITNPLGDRPTIALPPTRVWCAYEPAIARWVLPDWIGFPRPIGSAKVWLGGAVPSGWLAAGSEVSRTTYATLFSIVGTTGGVGDGSTTFDVPDPGPVLTLGQWIVYAGR
jgi:hypothetical protein